jgi:hypothetical protein
LGIDESFEIEWVGQLGLLSRRDVPRRSAQFALRLEQILSSSNRDFHRHPRIKSEGMGFCARTIACPRLSQSFALASAAAFTSGWGSTPLQLSW